MTADVDGLFTYAQTCVRIAHFLKDLKAIFLTIYSVFSFLNPKFKNDPKRACVIIKRKIFIFFLRIKACIQYMNEIVIHIKKCMSRLFFQFTTLHTYFSSLCVNSCFCEYDEIIIAIKI